MLKRQTSGGWDQKNNRGSFKVFKVDHSEYRSLRAKAGFFSPVGSANGQPVERKGFIEMHNEEN